MKLSAKEKRLQRKMRKRARRALRSRQCGTIERQLQRFFGKEYSQMKRPMDPAYMRLKTNQLNKSNFKSERLMREALARQGINNYFPNRALLNRWFGDFVFERDKLVLEVDGKSHEGEEQQKRDDEKDFWLFKAGYVVIRVNALDNKSLDCCAKYLKRILNKPEMHLNERTKPTAVIPLFEEEKYQRITKKERKRLLNKKPKKVKKIKMPFMSKEQVRNAVDQYVKRGGVIIRKGGDKSAEVRK